MGVTGLWQILEQGGLGHPIKVEALEGKRIAVDASVWLFQFIRGFRDKDDAVKLDAHKIGLFSRICKLLYYKVKPVFVFDGPAPVLKRKTLDRRRDVRQKTLDKVKQSAKQHLINHLQSLYPDKKIEDLCINLPNLTSDYLVAAEKLTDEDRELYRIADKQPDLITIDSCEESTDEEVIIKESKDSFVKKELNVPSSQIYESDTDDGSSSNLRYSHKNDKRSLEDIDINSEDFKSLPAEVRHEILTDIKESRRRIKTHVLPDDANNFSSLQMERLRNRRIVQAKIEECEKEIQSSLCQDANIDNRKSILESYRVQSDPNARILYLKDLISQKQTQEISMSYLNKNNCDEDDDKPVSDEMKPLVSSIKDKIKTKETSSPNVSKIQAILSKHESNELHNGKIKLSSPKVQKSSLFGRNNSDEIDKNPSQDTNNDETILAYLSETDSDTDIDERNPESQILQTELNAKTQSSENSEIQKQVQATTTIQFDETNCDEDDDDDDKPVSDEMKNLVSSLNNKIQTQETSSLNESKLSPSKTLDCIEDVNQETPDKVEQSRRQYPTDNLQRKQSDKKIVAEKFINEGKELQNIANKPPTLITIDSCDENTDEEVVINESKNRLVERELDIEELFKSVTDDESSNNLRYSNRNIKGAHEGIDSSSEDSKRLPAGVGNEIIEDSQKSKLPPSESSLFRSNNLDEIIQSASQETSSDVQSMIRKTRNVTDKIVEESKELLRLFGIPYIVAPGEAEAQCAVLESLGLTEGTITDDSDIWLFGARNVYRHFFSKDKYVSQYKMTDIEFKARLTRENLICLAMLVGSDYTEGVYGIGAVHAIEIISEFDGKGLEPLIKFKEWRDNYSKSKDRKPGNKSRERLLRFSLPDHFPSRVVYDGYMKPCLDTSDEQFSWSFPRVDELREYAKSQLGYTDKILDEKLTPVINKLKENKVQPRIDSFFLKREGLHDSERFNSKRVNKALSKISSQKRKSSGSEQDEDVVEVEVEKKKSKRQKKISKPRKTKASTSKQ